MMFAMMTGRPATATVRIAAIPTVNDTLTINGTVLTFTGVQGVGNFFSNRGTLYDVARSITMAVNGDSESYSDKHLRDGPFVELFAVQYSTIIRMYANQGGVGGNAFTLATSNPVAFVISGATFTGGA